MSVVTSDTQRKHHRAFRPAPPQTADSPAPTLSLERDADVLAEVLPTERLKALAAQHGALDQRERQVPVTLFFWAMVLSQAPGAVVSLETIVVRLTAAAI